MSKNYAKAKGRGKHKFVMLRHDIMDSPKYLKLSAKARCTLNEVMRRYNGHNNGAIPLSCREVADRMPISKDTASKAFNELLDAGFIKEHPDNSMFVMGRMSRRWILTFEDYNNKPPSNEWKK